MFGKVENATPVIKPEVGSTTTDDGYSAEAMATNRAVVRALDSIWKESFGFGFKTLGK